MDQPLRQYFSSFKVKKTFWVTFLAEVLFFGLLGITFSRFGTYIQNRSLELLGGRTAEQIQELILNNPEQALPLVEGLKSFLLVSVGGIVMLALISFFLFSLDQAFVWNYLQGRKVTSKTYWRWNALHLALLIPLLLYALGALIVKLIFSWLLRWLTQLSPTFYLSHATAADAVLLILNNALSFLLVLFGLAVLFLIYSTFAHRYQVWPSLGEGFHLLKMQWPSVWKMLLLMMGTAIVVTILFFPVKKALFLYPLAEMAARFIVSFLFLAWMRIYVLKIVAGTGS